MDGMISENIIWKESINGKYLVSEYGDIINIKTGKKLKGHIGKSGYVRIGKQIQSNGKSGGVHRVVYEAFVGVIPEGLQINHIDGNKLNNHITNLELVTPSENIIHAFRTGLSIPRKGELNGGSKVTEQDIVDIYSLIRQGYTNDYIGNLYNLHSRYVSLIRHGRRWSHLFIREDMVNIKSIGNLPFNLTKCIYIFNKCLNSGTPQDILAKELGIDSSTVSRVRTGKTWKTLRAFYNVHPETYNWKELQIKL